MAEIFLLKPMCKPSKNFKILFEERKSTSADGVENIFYDPSKLLEACGLKAVLNKEPFEYITTAGRVWEFYLLRFASDIHKSEYNHLIKSIGRKQSPIEGCRRSNLGNPFDKWKGNYKAIDNNDLSKATLSFVKKLVSRQCPIRQNGTDDFSQKRKKAAKSFFNYLTGGTIKQNFFNELRDCPDMQIRLAKLINEYPSNKLFITSGLMTCLYGGKNVDWVDSKLSIAVYRSLNNFVKTETMQITHQLLKATGSNKKFKPPFKNIYDVNFGNRERVILNFRIQTWLKLLEDTLNASR